MSHDCSSGDNGISADGCSGQYGGSRSDPHVPFDRYRLHGDVVPTPVRFDRVTGRDQAADQGGPDEAGSASNQDALRVRHGK